jgi:hypothetical protein
VIASQEIEISFENQAVNNGNLFLRAKDCDIGEFVPGLDDDAPPIVRTTCLLLHPLNNPEDYAHTSACITDDGTGILLTRPILSASISSKDGLKKIYESLNVPSILMAKHKRAVHETNVQNGRVGTYTTLYRFPSDFVASNQFFAESGAPTGSLKPCPVHHDVEGEYGFRQLTDTHKEPIKQVPIYAVAYLFVEKEEESEEGPSIGTRDLNRDMARTFDRMKL